MVFVTDNNGNCVEKITSLSDIYDFIASNYDEEYYNELLDEIYEPVQIGYATYYVSAILQSVDPIAYRCGMNDMVDGESCDVIYELEHYGTAEWNGFTFEEIKQ